MDNKYRYTCTECGTKSVVRADSAELTMKCGCSKEPTLHKAGWFDVAKPKAANTNPVPVIPPPVSPPAPPKPTAPVISNASKPSVTKPTESK